MFTTILKRKTRESGFTMIELLVVVVIIAILAAIAVPVYLNLRAGAAQSALKSDVNFTVKKAAIALTQGTDIADITANNGAAYVPSNLAKGETITIEAADPNATGAAFIQDRDNSSDGYIIKSATYTGSASGVAAATTVAAADNQYFTVSGSLSKSAGAPVDYTYNYSSVSSKYTGAGSSGGGTTTPTTPATTAPPAATATITTTTLPSGTEAVSYNGQIAYSGTASPVFSSPDLTSKTGLSLGGSGAITGFPSGPGTFTFTVNAKDGSGVLLDSKSVSVTFAAGPALTLDFENNTGGFVAGYGSVSSSTDQHYGTGAYSLKGSGDSIAFDASLSLPALTVGKSYTLTAYVLPANGNNDTIIGVRNSAYNQQLCQSAFAVGNATWQKMTCTFTYQAGAKLQLDSPAYKTAFFDHLTVG